MNLMSFILLYPPETPDSSQKLEKVSHDALAAHVLELFRNQHRCPPQYMGYGAANQQQTAQTYRNLVCIMESDGPIPPRRCNSAASSCGIRIHPR